MYTNESKNLYPYSYILFREHGDDFNSAFFRKGYTERDLQGYENVHRSLGFKFKKNGELKKAKEAFSKAALDEDPISQYELAHLREERDAQYEHLLKLSSPHLFQAKVSLYRLYLQKGDYDNANISLRILMDLKRRLESSCGKRLAIKELPEAPEKFVIYENEAGDHSVKDQSTGKWIKHKLPKFHEVLYKNALSKEGQERIHLYNLAALNGDAKASVELYKLKAEKREKEERFNIQKILVACKAGDGLAVEELVKLAERGDMATLGVLFEMSLLDNTSYYINVLEKASQNGSPLARCALGQMYYGKYTKEIGQLYTKGTPILRSKELLAEVEKLAKAGNVMAQYYMGVIGKEGREYHTAEKWFGKSSIHYFRSLHELGDLYAYGIHTGMRNTATDPEQAEVCYRKCAELGYFLSQHALGLMAFHKKNFDEALYWLQKSAEQGYIESVEYLKRVMRSGYEQEFKDWAATAIVALEKTLFDQNNQNNQSELEKITQKIDNLLQEEDMIQTVDNSSQQQPLVQQNALQGEEEQKIDGDDSEKIKESSHNKQILSLTDIIYDNPWVVAEAQVSPLMRLIEKNVSIPETQMDIRSHGKKVRVFNEELGSFLPMEQPSLAKAPLVSLTQAAFLDEKLVSQVEYFSQTGVAFFTLQDAAGLGTVHILDGLPPESILDSALNWMSLSHLLQGESSDASDQCGSND